MDACSHIVQQPSCIYTSEDNSIIVVISFGTDRLQISASLLYPRSQAALPQIKEACKGGHS